MSGSSQAQYPAPVLAGLFGANNQNFSPVPYPNTPTAAGNALGSIEGFNITPSNTAIGGYGASGGLINQGQNFVNSAANPINTAAGWAPWAFNSGNSAADIGGSIYGATQPYANMALQQGFDPQRALHDKLFQQQQDQSRAENAAAGVATTPYGAGLVQQGNQNFDIAWQQAQLANQAQGANTASQLFNTGYGALTSGLGAQQRGFGLGSDIYSQLYGAGANLLGAGQGAIGAGEQNQLALQLANQGATQQQIADYLAYLSQSQTGAAELAGAQTGSFGASNQLFGNQVSQNFGQQQLNNQALGGIGSLLGAGLGFFL